jgi:hypothetical protein
MKRRKRTISGIEAVDLARFWLEQADGDHDDAVEKVRKYESGLVRERTIIAAIRFLERQADAEDAQTGQPPLT